MTGYKSQPTQEQRILELLRIRGSRGLFFKDIPDLLGIYQYNSRIFGLRKKGYVIKDIENRFYLMYDPQFEKNGQGKFL